MIKTLFWLLMLLSFCQTNAQHDNNWYFGDHAGVDFSSGSPVPLAGSQMYTYEGSAVVSDTDGQLLFYTNGETVWNKNHEVMASGIGGHTSATQSAVVVPHPAQQHHYFIFTLKDAAGAGGLRYSEVDMSGNNGMGSILSLNQPITSTVCEKLVATLHSNGVDIWIIVHDFGNNAFLSYLVTGNGINPNPIISYTGTVINDPIGGDFTGYMALSPNATKLATGSSYVGVELFDFDNSTGVVSNPIVLSNYWGYNYGIEFSPKSNMLYATYGQALYQYNLEAVNVAESETHIANITTPGAIKIGPDSKLYVVNNMAISKLSVINKPDLEGTACNFELASIHISGQTQWGLPSFFASPFYILDIIAQNACVGNDVSFSTICTEQPDSIFWDFGDGTTTLGLNPVHEYTASGTYIIKIKAQRGSFVRYFTKEIIIYEGVIASQPKDLEMVTESGECNQIFHLNEQDDEILGIQSTADFTVSYHSSVDDAISNNNPLPYNYTNTATMQTIYARVSVNQNDCYAITSFLINVVCDTAGALADMIPRGLSPNYDNLNDNFDLSGFNVQSLSVFNRYGNKVYSKTDYTNEWYGQTNSGKELPTGVYYYSIETTKGLRKTGWVYINR